METAVTLTAGQLTQIEKAVALAIDSFNEGPGNRMARNALRAISTALDEMEAEHGPQARADAARAEMEALV
jgi:hypothetical protein